MKSLLIFISLLISLTSFSQSPWVKKKGEAYTQLSYSSISGYSTIFGDPDYNTERKISDNTLQFYGEYGLSNKTTLIINLPLKIVKTGGLLLNITPRTTAESKTALGNIELGVKHNFYKKDWLISGQLNIEANTGVFNEASGIRTGYDAFTITPLVSFGKGSDNFYIQGFTGLNLRTNGYSSNFKIGGEIGTKAINKLWVIGFLDIVKSFEDGSVEIPITNQLTALYVNNQDYGGFGLKIIKEFTDDFGLTGAFGGAFFGNNVAKQATLSFGVYHHF